MKDRERDRERERERELGVHERMLDKKREKSALLRDECWVCMYMMYICMCACTYVCMYPCIYACMHACFILAGCNSTQDAYIHTLSDVFFS